MRSLVERDVIVDNLLDVVEDHRLRLRVLEENIQGVEQGVAGPHNLLSATHGDTVTAAVSRGALAYGNSTPAWAALAIGAAGTILRSDGTDVAWATLGTAGIAPNDAQYVVMTASGGLTVERVLSAGDGLTRTDGGAGNSVTIDVGAGTGIAVNANDVQISHLGIESLTDPNDDQILFWDDGAGATAWLDPGSGPVISGTTLNVDHDACTNFAADEHVAHSGVSITAGAGLTGGGTIAATRTIDVGAGDGITVNANDVALTTPGTCTVATGNVAAGNHTHAITTSSSPGASASILASNASGLLRLVGLGIGANGATNWIIMADGTTIGQAAGPRITFDDTNNHLEITGGEVLIGDTDNAVNDAGVTLNIGTSALEAFSLKHDSVDHGITNRTETDTYGTLRPASTWAGGLTLDGLSEDEIGMFLHGVGTVDDTTKGVAGAGYVVLAASKKSGTSFGVCGANSNLVVIRDSALARFIFDKEGEIHTDDIIGVGHDWDEWDDLVLASDLSRMPPGKFDEVLKYNAKDFERAGLVTLSIDAEGNRHAFIKHKAMLMFYANCFREVHRRLVAVERFGAYTLAARGGSS